jgi:hypothetical protein
MEALRVTSLKKYVTTEKLLYREGRRFLKFGLKFTQRFFLCVSTSAFTPELQNSKLVFKTDKSSEEITPSSY